jgi:hypothetical protein
MNKAEESIEILTMAAIVVALYATGVILLNYLIT